MEAFGRATAGLKLESYDGGRDSRERMTQVSHSGIITVTHFLAWFWLSIVTKHPVWIVLYPVFVLIKQLKQELRKWWSTAPLAPL